MAVEDRTVPDGTNPAGRRPIRLRLSGVVARLTAANVVGAATGFITGPLLARALGPSGRGDLAAITVPLALVPTVLTLGIPAFAYRSLPRGKPAKEVIGSLGAPLLLLGLLTAAAAVPVADVLAGGRETVRVFLIIGLSFTPLVLLSILLSSCLSALERWNAVVLVILIPFLVPFLAIVVLYSVGRLTVASAAAATIAGSLLALAPCVPLLISSGRPVFRVRLAREGISFGVKSWLGGLASLFNARFDQFLMITVVTPRELGLYAVATTLSGAAGLATGAISPPLMTRIGAGERQLMPQAVRMALLVTAVVNLPLALATPSLLTLLFGAQFEAAVPMALILLAAYVPFAGAAVLSTALQADGVPLIPTAAEAIAILITVGGLIALLKPLGGVGAAIVSLAAYSASFGFQTVMAARRLRVSVSAFLIPCRSDLSWALARIGGLVARTGLVSGWSVQP